MRSISRLCYETNAKVLKAARDTLPSLATFSFLSIFWKRKTKVDLTGGVKSLCCNFGLEFHAIQTNTCTNIFSSINIVATKCLERIYRFRTYSFTCGSEDNCSHLQRACSSFTAAWIIWNIHNINNMYIVHFLEVPFSYRLSYKDLSGKSLGDILFLYNGIPTNWQQDNIFQHRWKTNGKLQTMFTPLKRHGNLLA